MLSEIKYTIGKSVFDTGTFDVRKGGLSSQQQIDFGSDEYFRFSFSPEFGTVLGDQVNLETLWLQLHHIKAKEFSVKNMITKPQENAARDLDSPSAIITLLTILTRI